MKKLFSFIIMLAFVVGVSFANNADLFTYDEATVASEFEQLDKLESFVLNNDGVSLTYLQDVNNEILAGINLPSASGMPFGPNQTMLDFDIAAFLWGWLCCPVGFFVVVTNKNKTGDQKLSYWIGVGVAVVFGSVSGGSVVR